MKGINEKLKSDILASLSLLVKYFKSGDTGALKELEKNVRCTVQKYRGSDKTTYIEEVGSKTFELAQDRILHKDKDKANGIYEILRLLQREEGLHPRGMGSSVESYTACLREMMEKKPELWPEMFQIKVAQPEDVEFLNGEFRKMTSRRSRT